MKPNFKYFSIFLILLFAIISLFTSPNMALAQEDPVIEALSRSSKIINPERVLKDFIDGKSTTRVIINLSKPPNFQQVTDFKDLHSREALREAVNSVQNMVITRMEPSHFRLTNKFTYLFGLSAEVTLKGLQALTEMEEVASIQKDEILYPHLAQGIPLMNASTVRTTYNGQGISIAICDTGIDYTHPMLGNGSFPNTKVIGGYDFGDDDTDPMDCQGHGTCCAGIAAGDLGIVGNYIGGVAYNAKLYALKIVQGCSGSAYTADMIDAWDWCVDHQYDDPNNPIMVISTSFGGYYYKGSCDSAFPLMTQAAANAVAAGITIFASSGNDGYCDGTAWPACISYVNSVGAVYDANIGSVGYCIDQDSCIGYYALGCRLYGDPWACDDPSTYADLVTCYSNSANFLDLLAPSNNCYTTDISGSGGYSSGDYVSTFGGTSAACPYAAGAAACLQSAAKAINGSFLSPTEVRSILTSTGDPITDPKNSITKPRINLEEAINSLTGCTYSIDPTSADFSASGGTGSVDVTTQSGCAWTATSNDSWIHITSGSSGTGSGTVNYSVDENTGSARTGTMTIAGQTFTVNQAAASSCTYTIDPTSANFPLTGGIGMVNVTTQAGCQWTVVSNDSWILLIGGGTRIGSGRVRYRVLATTTSRTGTMTIAGQTFTVIQRGYH